MKRPLTLLLIVLSLLIPSIVLSNTTNALKLPVSELHVHAEAGILSPEVVDYLAKKNHLQTSSKDFFRDGILYNKPGDFMDFLDVYDKATALIQTPGDLTYVVYDYLRRSHDDGAIYVELTTSPMHFRQMSYPVVVSAVAAAIDKAREDFGIEARILIVILRHKGPIEGEKMLNQMLAYRHPYVVGISLAGDDIHFPARAFSKIYTRAKEAGLKLSAHMGEHTGPDDIRTAIDMKLDRIGHGVSVVKDRSLMKEVVAKRIGFEVCPSSNIDLGYGTYKSFQSHPLRIMLKNNLFVSISTDDPAFLHTSIGSEYKYVQQAYGLSERQMIQLCRNSVEMSFAEPELKAKLLARIVDYEASIH